MPFSARHVNSGCWLSSLGPIDVLQRAGHAARRASGSGLPKVNNPVWARCATSPPSPAVLYPPERKRERKVVCRRRVRSVAVCVCSLAGEREP